MRVSSFDSIDRRRLLHLGLGGAGTLAASSLLPGIAWSAERHPPLGTWPAGVAGDSVFVGVTAPLTGPYSPDGKDHVLGYERAFAEINAASPTARAWGLKGRGVLGKRIRYQVADTETKPNLAVQAQTRFIDRDKAIMVTGSVSSSSSVALEELAQREKVLNMVGVSGSNATTGKDCRRYGFRSEASAYTVNAVLVPVPAKERRARSGPWRAATAGCARLPSRRVHVRQDGLSFS